MAIANHVIQLARLVMVQQNQPVCPAHLPYCCRTRNVWRRARKDFSSVPPTRSATIANTVAPRAPA